MLRRSIIAATGLLLTVVSVASAHHIASVTVDCPGSTIVVNGEEFGDQIGATVTVTGPDGYLQTFVVETASFSTSLPLGPNGAYTADWPGSSDGGGAFSFTVDCPAATASVEPSGSVAPTESAPATATPASPSSEPTGGVEGATGTPRITPPATDAATSVASAPGNGLMLALVTLAAVTIAAALAPGRRHLRR